MNSTTNWSVLPVNPETRVSIGGTHTHTVVERLVWQDPSCKGKPSPVYINKCAIERVLCWFDGNGNPNYSYRMADGSRLYLGSDYGAMNNLSHGRIVVSCKKDL